MSTYGGDSIISGSLNVDSGTLTVDDDNNRVGIGTTTPYTAFSVVHDYNSTTFENQISDNQGGGCIIKYGTGTLTAGELHFLHTDAEWRVTDADAVASGASQLLGISMGTSPTSDGMLLKGFYKVSSAQIQGTAVLGAAVYVSEDAGSFDFTAPSATSDFVRIVGYCIDIDSSDILLYFNPDSTWIEVA